MEHYEVEDFDLTPACYRVLLQAYNSEGEELGVLVSAECPDPEEAITFAEKKATELSKTFKESSVKWDDQEIRTLIVSVETVVVVDDEEAYIGTLFKDTIFAN